MRILRFLFTSIIVLGILAGVSFLIGREVLLYMGTASVREGIKAMRDVSSNAGSYTLECQKKGVTGTSIAIERIQLRFTSPTEYQVEVVCNQFLLDPVVVSQAELPFMVQKISPNSGLIWNDEPQAVSLGLFGRSRSVSMEYRDLTYSNQTIDVAPGSGPVTSCSGYGYSCCQAESQLGQGEQIGTANDCPKSCFQSCVARPIVLSFITQPFFETTERAITVNSGDEVELSYVVDKGGSPNVMVDLDFGDGNQGRFNGTSGSVTHLYTCSQAQCEYIARLTVTNATGVAAAATPLSQISITVVP